MNTPSAYRPEIETARRKIGEAACGMVDGSLSFLEGAQQIFRLISDAKLSESDPDILVMTGIISETDNLPIGDERKHWAPEALVRLQPEFERAENWAKHLAFKPCQNLIRRFALALRPYTPADEDASIDLWRRTWQKHYPHIDFAARVGWWRERWRNELVPAATITLAERDGALVGFVTVDTKTRYLDQFVVAPEAWGSDVAVLLMDEAKRLSPSGLDLLVNKDNLRAIHFYEKHGFAYAGEDKNPVSGIAVNRMAWRPDATPKS